MGGGVSERRGYLDAGLTHQSVSKTTFLLYPAAIGDIAAA